MFGVRVEGVWGLTSVLTRTMSFDQRKLRSTRKCNEISATAFFDVKRLTRYLLAISASLEPVPPKIT
jgi:hypothetical protein